jgi:hypothetical protein
MRFVQSQALQGNLSKMLYDENGYFIFNSRLIEDRALEAKIAKQYTAAKIEADLEDKLLIEEPLVEEEFAPKAQQVTEKEYQQAWKILLDEVNIEACYEYILKDDDTVRAYHELYMLTKKNCPQALLIFTKPNDTAQLLTVLARQSPARPHSPAASCTSDEISLADSPIMIRSDTSSSNNSSPADAKLLSSIESDLPISYSVSPLAAEDKRSLVQTMQTSLEKLRKECCALHQKLAMVKFDRRNLTTGVYTVSQFQVNDTSPLSAEIILLNLSNAETNLCTDINDKESKMQAIKAQLAQINLSPVSNASQFAEEPPQFVTKLDPDQPVIAPSPINLSI